MCPLLHPTRRASAPPPHRKFDLRVAGRLPLGRADITIPMQLCTTFVSGSHSSTPHNAQYRPACAGHPSFRPQASLWAATHASATPELRAQPPHPPPLPCRSAPAVTPSTSNPAILQCAAPVGGPWATCKLQLCKQELNRRRLQSTCTPIDVYCPFVSGVANCNVTGKVVQDFPFQIVSTAVKADGVRMSATGPQPTYTLPLFP